MESYPRVELGPGTVAYLARGFRWDVDLGVLTIPTHLDMQLISGPALPSLGGHSNPNSPGAGLPAEVSVIYPMTSSQEGLWLAYLAEPRHTAYNLTMKFSLPAKDPKFSLESLLNGIHTLTARHGILRSTFHHGKKRPLVAEWEPSAASPSVRIISSSFIKASKLHDALRSVVDLSSEFATRWVIVKGEAATELFLIAHHIALDGTSMRELSAEFFDILLKPSEFEVKQIRSESFQSVHAIEAAFRASPAFQDAKEFWIDQCRNTSPIKWKDYISAPASTNYREIKNWFTFSKDELARWSARYGTSWFRVAVCVLGLVVRTWADDTTLDDHDYSVTVAFSGRPASLAQTRVIGQFANALPIRIPTGDILRSGNPTFNNLVRVVSSAISMAKKHQYFSSLDLFRALHSAGHRAPRSQVAITLSPPLARPKCCLYPVEGQCDLFFCFLDETESVSLGVIYDPLIFSESAISGFQTDFQNLMSCTMDEKPLDLATIPGLIEQIPQLLSTLDVTDSDQISAIRFHTMFEQQVRRNPMATALFSAEQGKSITYGELNETSNRLAHYLRKSGIQPNFVVLLHLRRGFSLMTWILAVLKSGAAYAVADQSHPLERIRHVISIADPSLVVDDGDGGNVAGVASKEKFFYPSSPMDDMPPHNLEDITQPNDLAYVVFTSGKPKGVEIEHRNLSHFIVNAYTSGYLSITPGSRVLQFASFAFDAAVAEWALCLSLGGTLCFADHSYLVGDYLAKVIDANKITHIQLTPSVLATLHEHHRLPSLLHISVEGEMVPDGLINIWRSRVNLQNAYGPSEWRVPLHLMLLPVLLNCCFCSTIGVAHEPQPRGVHDIVPSAAIIGKPYAKVNVYVCSENFDRILPSNEAGELCISGPQVGRGYRNRPDLTKQRFMVHSEVGSRLFRTGDRGKILADGRVLLLGRLDREVKVRGYRIDLEDLERIISELMPHVLSVSAQTDSSRISLYAFVTPQTIDGQELKRRVATRLPSYMVPDAVYALDCLPLNSNDKIDHRLIQQIIPDLVSKAAALADKPFPPPPHSPSSLLSLQLSTLETISRIWANVLDLPELPLTTGNFFRLGGLLAQSLTDRLKMAFPLSDLTVVDIFTHPTPKDLVYLLENEQARLESTPRGLVGSNATQTNNYNNAVSPTLSLQDDVEHEILDIWETVLRTNFKSTSIDFYNAGGNSVLLSSVHSHIRRKWPHAEANIVDLFHHRTVQDQAAFVLKSITASANRINDTIPAEFTKISGRADIAPPQDVGPQQHVFMCVAQDALADAGWVWPVATPNNVGMYVGATWHQNSEPQNISAPSISAATAYHLNLQGPNLTLDTACSSGLVAMSLAVDHLRDQRADGTVPADAACALVLRRLDDAIENEDKIYSLISGIAFGCDGKVDKAELAVPSPRGQAENIKCAWHDAGLNSACRLHGSGTAIGDAIELEGMHMARKELGASQAASGLVSVIKMCKSMQYGIIPPLQSFEALHPVINQKLPVQMATTGVPISSEGIVSVSAIGLGGVNAHCIMRPPPALLSTASGDHNFGSVQSLQPISA
ncbi:hypothetical protein C8J57DRAFT_1243659 [Mycena rebaudengoi]|nr:hypothetical protein C8J57DRAFT_1243659 [Mycena rebaudengoi]